MLSFLTNFNGTDDLTGLCNIPPVSVVLSKTNTTCKNILLNSVTIYSLHKFNFYVLSCYSGRIDLFNK